MLQHQNLKMTLVFSRVTEGIAEKVRKTGVNANTHRKNANAHLPRECLGLPRNWVWLD
jgi:hypothetical protein